MAQFTNQAQLSFNDTVINSNVAVGEIAEALTAAKTAVRTTYAQEDESVTYVINIVNSGSRALRGLRITDDLGGYEFEGDTVYPLSYVDGTLLYYVNGELQTEDPEVEAGPPLEISGITVPADGSVLLIYEARLTQYAPREEGASITNTAVICGKRISRVTVTETITAANEPLLTITKSISPVPVEENGLVTYTFQIENTGNCPVTENDEAVITDEFDPPLCNLNVTFNDDCWTEDDEFTFEDNVFTSTAGKVTVPAATFEQNPQTGAWTTIPSVSTLVIAGRIADDDRRPGRPDHDRPDHDRPGHGRPEPRA